MKTELKVPCNECPFRKISVQGWLGPWDPQALLATIQYEPFPCHKTIKSDGQSFDDPTLQACAGAALFLSNKLQLSRDPQTAAYQQKLSARAEIAKLKASVFRGPQEFLNHHLDLGDRKEAS